MKDLRSLVVKVVIGSFGLAALMGIGVLLGAGEFGDTQARILLTTVIVGVESIAVLCYLAVAGRPAGSLGMVGGLVSAVPTALGLWFTWSDAYEYDTAWRLFGASLTVAASIAQACLLLSRDHRRSWLLTGTLTAVLVVAAMIIGPIFDLGGDGDLYWRLFGVVAILDALGTVAVIALSVFGDEDQPPPVGSGSTELSTAVAARLAGEATRRGTSPDELVTRLLDDLG